VNHSFKAVTALSQRPVAVISEFQDRYRRWRKRRVLRRRLQRLAEVDVTPTLAPLGLMVSIVLTTKPDTMRHGAILSGDYAAYVRPWWKTIQGVGLRGVLLHDGLPAKTCLRLTTDRVQLERVHPGDWPLYHERHRLIRRYLESVQDDWVFITDVSDVAVKWNPFEIVRADGEEHRLFVGSESGVIRDSEFMRKEMLKQFGALLHPDRQIVNPGILGGRRDEVIEVLDLIIGTTAEYGPPTYGTDMSVFNKVIYDNYLSEELLSGHPLHSRYRNWEFHTSAAIMHK
jgi:hypothetical protein